MQFSDEDLKKLAEITRLYAKRCAGSDRTSRQGAHRRRGPRDGHTRRSLLKARVSQPAFKCPRCGCRRYELLAIKGGEWSCKSCIVIGVDVCEKPEPREREAKRARRSYLR